MGYSWFMRAKPEPREVVRGVAVIVVVGCFVATGFWFLPDVLLALPLLVSAVVSAAAPPARRRGVMWTLCDGLVIATTVLWVAWRAWVIFPLLAA